MKLILFIIKIPYYLIKGLFKIISMILKPIFQLLFGLIPDFNDSMSGEDFEQYVALILKCNGYKNITLTKRSGDYGIDIIAEYNHKKYAIQCKKYAKPVGVSAIQQAYSGCQFYECDYAVVVTNNRFTAQAIALSKQNDVDLWDGSELQYLKRRGNRHALFHHKVKEKQKESPYQEVLLVLLEAGYASSLLLEEKLHYSEAKSFYILDDLEYHDLVSSEDHLGIRDLYFLSLEEALDMLES